MSSDDPRFKTQSGMPGTGELRTDGLPVEQRVLLLERELNTGFASLRNDLARYLSALTERDAEYEKRLEKVEHAYTNLNAEHIGRCAETRLSIDTLKGVSESMARIETQISGINHRLEEVAKTLVEVQTKANIADDKVEKLRDELEVWLRETWGTWLPWFKVFRWGITGISSVLLVVIAGIFVWAVVEWAKRGAWLP